MARDVQVHLRRQVLNQKRETLMNGGSVDDMIVVEYEDKTCPEPFGGVYPFDKLRAGSELVEGVNSVEGSSGTAAISFNRTVRTDSML